MGVLHDFADTCLFLAAWAVGLADEPDVTWLDVIAAALDLVVGPLIDLADPDVWPGLLPA